VKDDPLLKLSDFGQSIWLDFISRDLLDSGDLKRLIDEHGLRGVTTNPTILDEAISGTDYYDHVIKKLVSQGLKSEEIYNTLALEDVEQALDLFRPLYDRTEGRHGFVSLEVSPYLAHDTQDTIKEARRYWGEVGRPNLLIKVPGTLEGLPAIRQLISESVNVNVTLLFGLERYRQVVDAYLGGLEDRLGQKKSLERISSVASFFLSRIDVLVDPLLERMMQEGGDGSDLADRLHGEVAIASAKVAYQIYNEICAGERHRRLVEKGARPQRLLWASTSTKNPEYSDVKYVESLIGPDTVNTLPLKTIRAYLDHGNPVARLQEDVSEAHQILDNLSEVGIDLDQVTHQLEDEGVEKFSASYTHVMKTLESKRTKV
jgi:transaldolase